VLAKQRTHRSWCGLTKSRLTLVPFQARSGHGAAFARAKVGLGARIEPNCLCTRHEFGHQLAAASAPIDDEPSVEESRYRPFFTGFERKRAWQHDGHVGGDHRLD